MRQRLPCTVLLDLMMPVMDGWEFRRHQLEDPALAQVPVLCITAVPNPVEVGATTRSAVPAEAAGFGPTAVRGAGALRSSSRIDLFRRLCLTCHDDRPSSRQPEHHAAERGRPPPVAGRRPGDHDRLHDHGQQQWRRRVVGLHETRRLEWPDRHRPRLPYLRLRDGGIGGVRDRKQARSRGDARADRTPHDAAGRDPLHPRHHRQQLPVLRARAHALLRRAAAHRGLLSGGVAALFVGASRVGDGGGAA